MNNDTNLTSDHLMNTAHALADELTCNMEVLIGLMGLRALGDEAPVVMAIAATLMVPDVRRLRLCWELFECLADDENVDGIGLLGEIVGEDDLAVMLQAFYGLIDDDCDCETCSASSSLTIVD